MAHNYVNLYDNHVIELEGKGGVMNKLKNNYKTFGTEPTDDPDLRCVVGPVNVDTNPMLGGTIKHAGRSGDELVLKDRGDLITLNRNLTELRCTSARRNWRVGPLIEGLTRLSAIESGLAMTHASAVVHEGKTIVFPAWRHTGKTNTMLEFLQRGASYLADDRLWLGEEGYAHPFQVPINLQPYNIRAFPDLDRSLSQKIRTKISHSISSFVSGRSSKLLGGLNLVNAHYIKPNYGTLHVSEQFPGQQRTEKAEIDAVVLLQTTTNQEPSITSIDTDKLTRTLSRINLEEFNDLLEDVGVVYDILFPEAESLFDKVRQMEQREREVFESVASQASVFKMKVPRETNWSDQTKQEISSTVVEALN